MFSFNSPQTGAAPAAGGFGLTSNAPVANLFGTPPPAGQPATPSFAGFGGGGAATTPQQQQAATPSFAGFGTGAAAGAATTPLFGAPQQPAAGGGAAPPLFGAASAPQPFGAQQQQQAGAPLGSPFGAAAQAAKPAQPGGAPSLFSGFGTTLQQPGAQAQAAQPSPLFASALPKPGGGPLSFGQLPGAQPPSLLQQPAPGALAAPGAPAPTTLVPQKEVEAIEQALTAADNNPRYRFRELLHNIVPDPAARGKPAGVDELRWREALDAVGGERNPDGMWPVMATGFGQLCERYGVQTRALAAQEEALGRAARELAARQRRHDALAAERLQRLRDTHEAQAHRLLRCARLVEALDASTAPHQPEPFQPEEVALRAKLAALRGELGAGGGALARRVEALRASARVRAAALPPPPLPHGGGAAAAAAAATQLERESVERLTALLAAQGDALRSLADVLKRDARDVAILTDAAAGAADGDAMRM